MSKIELNKVRIICDYFKNKTTEEIISYFEQERYSTPRILSQFNTFCLKLLQEGKGDINLAGKILKILNEIYLDNFKGTATLTFGEVAESHVGMQKIGKMAKKGFSIKDILKAGKYFKAKGCKVQIIHLNDFLPKHVNNEHEKKQLKIAKDEEEYQAYVLVVRNAISVLSSDGSGDALLREILLYDWDSKLFNEKKKIVQNKNARHNLNFSDEDQVAEFEAGKGTTVSWKYVPELYSTKQKIHNIFGESAKELKCEGNLYYKVGKTGIGYHGDTERKKVIGLRLGNTMTMHWMWYYNDKPRGLNVSIKLNKGDLYCMTEKTVGTDWREAPKKRYTLRHAAGAPMYTTETVKINIRNQRKENGVLVGDIYYRPKKSKKNPAPTFTHIL